MTDEATRAEKKLAAILLVEADVSISPEALRHIIRKHWRTIAPLAHIVHAAPDYTKEQQAAERSAHASRQAGGL